MSDNHSTRTYESILGLLSSAENPTPIVRLNHVVPFEHTKVYAKLEWYNPFGSVKDRIAANLVDDAEQREQLRPGKRLIEPTSGNTGLGLAMIANAKGYQLRTPLSDKIPVEKRAVLRFFGCDVIELADNLCPAPGAPEGAISVAMSTAQNIAEFEMLNQYVNGANPGAHYKTTGPEIWRQTDGAITHFVAGLGTCGTITGTTRFLKEQNPNVRVLGVHPQEGHDIPGVRSIAQLAQTALFLPELYDDMAEVSNEEAYALCLRLNREESIIAGPSSAMALAGALRTIEDRPGSIVVVIFPDNIFKYASSIVRHFPDIFEGMAGATAAASQEHQLMQQLCDNSANPYNTVEIADVAGQLKSSSPPVLVDVRSPEEYAKQRIAGAINIPTIELSGCDVSLPDDRNAPIVTVCNVGHQSLSGLLVLQSLGYRNAKSMNGGTRGWAERGLPTETAS